MLQYTLQSGLYIKYYLSKVTMRHKPQISTLVNVNKLLAASMALYFYQSYFTQSNLDTFLTSQLWSKFWSKYNAIARVPIYPCINFWQITSTAVPVNFCNLLKVCLQNFYIPCPESFYVCIKISFLHRSQKLPDAQRGLIQNMTIMGLVIIYGQGGQEKKVEPRGVQALKIFWCVESGHWKRIEKPRVSVEIFLSKKFCWVIHSKVCHIHVCSQVFQCAFMKCRPGVSIGKTINLNWKLCHSRVTRMRHHRYFCQFGLSCFRVNLQSKHTYTAQGCYQFREDL